MNQFLQSEYQKAQSHFANGNFDASKKILKNLIIKYPDIADIFNFLGVIFTAEKNFIEAKKSFKKAIDLRSNFAVAKACYAQLLIDFRYTNKACKYLNEAIEDNPNIPEFYINLGLLYIELESYLEAIKIAEIANVKFQNFPPILNIIGICYLNLGNPIKAKDYLLNAIKIAPDYSEAHLNLGNTLLEINEYENSLRYLEKAVNLDKSNGLAYKSLANYHKVVELNLNKSIDILNESLKHIDNNYHKDLLLSDLHDYYLYLGKKEEAKNIAKTLLNSSNDADIFMKNFYSLSKRKSITNLIGAEVNKAKFIIKENKNYKNLAIFHFSMAAINLNKKNIKDYVSNLKKANINLKKYYEYREKNQSCKRVLHKNFIKTIQESKLQFNKIKTKEIKDFNPIFIVGMPRSGSTLLDQILSSHSAIESVGEISFFSENNIKEPYLSFLQKNNIVDFQSFIEFFKAKYLYRIRKINGKINYFIDKTLTNYLYIDLILCAFPRAKFINIKREKKSNSWSIYKNPFQYGFYNWTCDFNEIFKIYDEYLDFVEHRFKKYKNNTIHINYEDLIFDNEQTVRNIINFIGLNFEDGCLEHHKNKNSIMTLSVDQAREKIYDESVKDWEKFKDFVPELKR